MIRAKLAPLAALAAVCASASARAESGFSLLNMPQGVTEISRKIYALHMEIFWVCVAIAVVVFGVMFWSIFKYRKSQGAVPDVTLVHNTKVEFIWTVVPVIILIAMAVPAARTLVEIEDTTNTELTIKVTGFQWGWQYDYLDDGVLYYSRLDRASRRGARAELRHRPAQRPALPAERRSPAGGAGRHQGAPADHRRGRHPFLVGAGLRREEGCDPGLHKRGLVQGRQGQTGPVPRPVRGTVRP